MKLLGILLIAFGFTQCGSMKLVKNPPFKIASSTYNNWVGGQPGVSGTRVEIKLSEKVDVSFDSLFFKNKSTKIEIRESNGKTFLTAHFDTSKGNNRDIVLHSDSKKEAGNKIPEVKKFPFELKENEAVISYKENGKIKYFKIEDVEQTKSDFFPKARQ